jgi:hypothetical protein
MSVLKQYHYHSGQAGSISIPVQLGGGTAGAQTIRSPLDDRYDVRPIAVATVQSNPSGNVVALPGAGAATIYRALGALRRFKAYSPGWDGGRASGPIPASLDLAEKFLALLAASGKPMSVEAQLFAAGTAVLNVMSSEYEAQFEFHADGVVAVNLDANDEEWDEDIDGFTGATIPPQLQTLMNIHV